MNTKEAIERIKTRFDKWALDDEDMKAIQTLIPELKESEIEDERIRRKMIDHFKAKTKETWCNMPVKDIIAYLEKQKEHHFTKRNALFDKCVENCDPIVMKKVSDEVDEMLEKEVMKAIEDVIRVYGKTQGEWIAGYDMDTLVVHLRKAFAALEKQKEHHLELNAGKWYICHRAFCARADHLTVKEGERFQCEKDGIVKGFVIKEPEKYFKECSAPEPMEKEQKPVESISQQTVQGKGVYKICPRCKERMIRDDSMVYTSMPPQYRYECPKCGESECDTVMYDSPETEEQKPAEWSEEDKEKIVTISEIIEHCTTIPYSGGTLTLNKEYKKELLCFIRTLRPSWKPSKEQMVALNALNCHGDLSYIGQQNQLISLYNDLKKLM